MHTPPSYQYLRIAFNQHPKHALKQHILKRAWFNQRLTHVKQHPRVLSRVQRARLVQRHHQRLHQRHQALNRFQHEGLLFFWRHFIAPLKFQSHQFTTTNTHTAMNPAHQLTLALPNPLAAREVLFLSTDGQPFTTSRAVAERFGKQHKDVLKAIENLLEQMPDPEFSRRNFALRMFTYRTGKGQLREAPEYRLTHDGFAFLAMRFTGRDAMAWQIAFLQAFNSMEAELHRLASAKAHALDVLRPCLQPVIDGQRVGANRALIARYMGKSLGAVSYHRRVARRLGLLAR